MEFKKYGIAETALFLNNKIFGWVGMTIDGKFTYLLSENNKIDKKLFSTKLEAKLSLMKLIGE